MSVAIGIYKIPPKWNSITNIKNVDHIKCTQKNITDFNEHKTRKTSVLDNIYYQIFKQIVNIKDFQVAHYIFVDENNNETYYYQDDNIYIWIINSIDEMYYFRDGDFYFVRGNYLDFYHKFIPMNANIFFYPATSLVYKYISKKTHEQLTKFRLSDVYSIPNIKHHDFYSRTNTVFIHEAPVYNKIYKSIDNIVNFDKFASQKYKYLDLERKYDFIFVADATQSTKNHGLFINFIEYCEKNKKKIKAQYITDVKVLETKYKLPKNLEHVNLSFNHNLNPENLNILFNKCKINLILSGRDACPRTISESLAAGCYNVCLNTLSDGKNYYKKKMGEIIKLEKSEMVVLSSHSISYKPSEILFEKILKTLAKKHNHQSISKKSLKKYNVNSLVNRLTL